MELSVIFALFGLVILLVLAIGGVFLSSYSSLE